MLRRPPPGSESADRPGRRRPPAALFVPGRQGAITGSWGQTSRMRQVGFRFDGQGSVAGQPRVDIRVQRQAVSGCGVGSGIRSTLRSPHLTPKPLRQRYNRRASDGSWLGRGGFVLLTGDHPAKAVPPWRGVPRIHWPPGPPALTGSGHRRGQRSVPADRFGSPWCRPAGTVSATPTSADGQRAKRIGDAKSGAPR